MKRFFVFKNGDEYVAQFAEKNGEKNTWEVSFRVTGKDFLSFLENVQVLKQFGQTPFIEGDRYSNGKAIIDGKIVNDGVFALKKEEFLRIKNILKETVPVRNG